MCELCCAPSASVPSAPRSMARRSVLKLGLAAGIALAPQALMAKPKEPPKPENVLSPDGEFIQFTYNMKKSAHFYPDNFILTKSFVVWRNIPPAMVTVFKIKKARP